MVLGSGERRDGAGGETEGCVTLTPHHGCPQLPPPPLQDAPRSHGNVKGAAGPPACVALLSVASAPPVSTKAGNAGTICTPK